MKEYIVGIENEHSYALDVCYKEELVRCKDCKHRYNGKTLHNCCKVLMEMSNWLLEMPVEDGWYCGSGERKRRAAK